MKLVWQGFEISLWWFG